MGPSGPAGPLLTSNPNGSNPVRLGHNDPLTCDQDHGYTADMYNTTFGPSTPGALQRDGRADLPLHLRPVVSHDQRLRVHGSAGIQPDHVLGPVLTQSQTSLDALTGTGACGSQLSEVPVNSSGQPERAAANFRLFLNPSTGQPESQAAALRQPQRRQRHRPDGPGSAATGAARASGCHMPVARRVARM